MAQRQISARFNFDGGKEALAELEAIGKAGESAQQKLAPPAKAVQDFEKLERSLGTTAAAAQRYEAQLARIKAAEEAGIGTAERRRQALEAAASSYARATERQASATASLVVANDNAGRGAQRFGQLIGQAGYQVQDFAVQVASGQSALTAFAQQGTQLLSAFGTPGIIAATALAIGAVVAKFVEGKSAAEQFNSAIEAQEAIYKAAQEAGEQYRRGLEAEAETILNLRAAYASYSEARRRAEELRLTDRQGDLEKQQATLRDRAVSGLGDLPAFAANAAAIGNAPRAPGVQTDQITQQLREAVRAVLEFKAAGDASAETLASLSVRLQDAAALTSGSLSQGFLDAARRIRELLPDADRLAQSVQQNGRQLDAVRDSGGNAAEGLRNAADAARVLADRMQQLREFAANNPLASIQSEASTLAQQLDALRRRGIDGLEGEQRAQENARRVNEASNRVYEEQLKRLLDLGRGQEAAEGGARSAAAQAAQETMRRNELGDSLEREKKAREEADRAAERAAQEEQRRSDRTSQIVQNAVQKASEDKRRAEERAAEDARQLARREAEQNSQRFDRTVERWGNSLADVTFSALQNGAARGESVFTSLARGFGSLLRRVASEALSSIVLQPVIRSGLSSIGYTGAESGSGSMLSSAGSLFNVGGTAYRAYDWLSGDGLSNAWTSASNTVSGWFGGSSLAGAGGVSNAATTGMGIYGEGVAGSMAVPGTTGLGAGLSSFGGFAGGIGIGFGAGSLVGNWLAGDSKARQQNAQLGAGGGALAGAGVGFMVGGPVGALVGGIVGGLGGGAGGGLIGPGRAFSGGDSAVAVNAEGRLIYDGYQGKNLDAALRTQLEQGTIAAMEQLNATMVALGLRFTEGKGAFVGGGESGNPTDLLGALQKFGVGGLQADDARIQGAISRTASITGIAQPKLSDTLGVAQRAKAMADTLDSITAPINAFQQALNALGAQFNPLEQEARQLGFGIEQLTAEHRKQSDELFRARDAQLFTYQQQLRVREMKISGDDVTAALVSADLAYRQEFAQFKTAVEALGLSAGDTATLLGRLTAAQQAERQEVERQAQQQVLQKQNGALSVAVSQSRVLAEFLASRDLSSGSPEAQLAAAQAQFDTAIKAARAAGATSADLSRVTSAASSLYSAGSSVYATGPAFTALDATIRATISGLGRELDLPAFADDLNASVERFIAVGNDQLAELRALRAANDAMREELRGLKLLVTAR